MLRNPCLRNLPQNQPQNCQYKVPTTLRNFGSGGKLLPRNRPPIKLNRNKKFGRPCRSSVFPRMPLYFFACPRIPSYSFVLPRIPAHSLAHSRALLRSMPSHSFLFPRIPAYSLVPGRLYNEESYTMRSPVCQKRLV